MSQVTPSVGSISDLLGRLYREDDAQDLVEYALLCAFVGLAGLAAWQGIVGTLSQQYQNYDQNTQGLWDTMPDP